ncbi:MAG: extracellular solute-binding protein [Eubacteriales bacterium]
MKKTLAILLMVSMGLWSVACGDTGSSTEAGTSQEDTIEVSEREDAVTLNVTSTFAGNDSNAQNYIDAYEAWEATTGNQVSDSSGTADELFKTRVNNDFEVGAEPDVLFYFNGSDADSFISAGKVVSIEEIQSVYPDYATNMNMEFVAASPVDGVQYAIPVNGYWEGLFVNETVLQAAGVEVPGADYTWEQFLLDCETIADAGYIPIAAALGNVPHYWFEFAIYNHLSAETHATVPTAIDDVNGLAWIDGVADIKGLYEQGYFPANTLSATDDETVQMFIDGKAAFLIDGSWKTGHIEDYAENIEDFTVTYVPGQGERAATDMIGGLSSGWYITRKAWEDPDKQAAAVDFVSYMTSDEVVSVFASYTLTALANPVSSTDVELSSLALDAIAMTDGATGVSGAVQDSMPTEARAQIFADIPYMVTGEKEITTGVQDVLDLMKDE